MSSSFIIFVIIILHFCHHPLSWRSFPILIIVILDLINIILLLETRILFIPSCTRVVEVARTREQHVRQKNWTWTKTLSLNIRNLVAINVLFVRLWANECFFGGQKQCFFGKKCTITWYILHIILN